MEQLTLVSRDTMTAAEVTAAGARLGRTKNKGYLYACDTCKTLHWFSGDPHKGGVWQDMRAGQYQLRAGHGLACQNKACKGKMIFTGKYYVGEGKVKKEGVSSKTVQNFDREMEVSELTGRGKYGHWSCECGTHYYPSPDASKAWAKKVGCPDEKKCKCGKALTQHENVGMATTATATLKSENNALKADVEMMKKLLAEMGVELPQA